MKIIHTSDWHFGMLTPTGRNYEDCQRYFLDRLYDLIRTEKVEAVTCAGDVYDTSLVSAEAIQLFNDAATTLCGELGVSFIVIAGNHDSASRLSACSELLKAAKMYVTGRIERDPEPVLLDGGKVAVYSLPYFQRDQIVALFPEKKEEIRTVTDGARVLLDHIRETMDSNRRNIIVSHAYITEAELSESDRAARLGHASAIPAEVFHGFDYVALGHIHKPQIMAPHIRYSGSPIKYSFGSEELQEKGVVLIDTDTMEQTFMPIPLFRDRKTLEGTYDEIKNREELRDCFLRIRVTDRYAGLELRGELQLRYPYLLELYGKSLGSRTEESTLTLEEIGEMEDEEILCKFLAECYDYEPTEEELSLFREAMEECEEDLV